MINSGIKTSSLSQFDLTPDGVVRLAFLTLTILSRKQMSFCMIKKEQAICVTCHMSVELSQCQVFAWHGPFDGCCPHGGWEVDP